MMFLKAYRWKKIMDAQEIRYSFENTFLMYGASYLFGLITPGKIGEFSRMAYLKKDNHPMGKVLFGNLLDKLSDLFFVILFIAFAALFIPRLPDFTFKYSQLLKWAGGGLLLAVVIFGFIYIKNKDKLYNFFSEIFTEIKRLKIYNLLFVFVITAVIWFLFFILIYFIGVSIGITKTAGFFYLSFTAAVSNLISLLPISVLGVGTREAVFIFLLAPLGIPTELIILFSLLVLVNYLSMFFICLACWLKKPVI